MKIVCLIPARYESKRFSGKALADLNGKPMIQRVYERVAQAKGISEVAIVTDDQRIAWAGAEFGANIILTSSAHRTGTDRIAEAAATMGIDDEDIVVNVQGDQPRINPWHIEQVAAPLLADPYLEMATLAYRIVRYEEITDENSVKVVFDRDRFALYFSRARVPYHGHEYFKHIGIYAYRRSFLRTFAALPESSLEQSEALEQLRALENGHKIKVVITEIDSPSVDTIDDLLRLRELSHGGCAG